MEPLAGRPLRQQLPDAGQCEQGARRSHAHALHRADARAGAQAHRQGFAHLGDDRVRRRQAGASVDLEAVTSGWLQLLGRLTETGAARQQCAVTTDRQHILEYGTNAGTSRMVATDHCECDDCVVDRTNAPRVPCTVYEIVASYMHVRAKSPSGRAGR